MKTAILTASSMANIIFIEQLFAYQQERMVYNDDEAGRDERRTRTENVDPEAVRASADGKRPKDPAGFDHHARDPWKVKSKKESDR